jgi:hypothetical protein
MIIIEISVGEVTLDTTRDRALVERYIYLPWSHVSILNDRRFPIAVRSYIHNTM